MVNHQLTTSICLTPLRDDVIILMLDSYVKNWLRSLLNSHENNCRMQG